MELGWITSYGRYNKKTGSHNDYGFIECHLTSELFFHKQAINPSSLPYFSETSHFPYNTFVLFDLCPDFRHPGKYCANNVSVPEYTSIEVFNKESSNIVTSLIGFLRDSFPKHNVDIRTIFKYINLTSIPVDDARILSEMLKERSFSAGHIYYACPAVWRSQSRIIAEMSIKDIEIMLAKGYVFSTQELHFLFQNIKRTDTKKQLCKAVSDDDLLLSEEYLPYIDDQRMLQIINKIDWRKTDQNYLAQYKRVLSFITANKYPESCSAIAHAMSNTDADFSLSWWKLFSDDIKAYLILYSSVYIEKNCLQKHWEKLHQISIHERSLDNGFILSLLYFLRAAYCAVYENQDQTQRMFVTGWNMYLSTLYRLIDRKDPMSHIYEESIVSVLPKCRVNYSNKTVLCDARYHKSDTNPKTEIWCPAKPDHLSAHSCGKPFREDMIFEDTGMMKDLTSLFNFIKGKIHIEGIEKPQYANALAYKLAGAVNQYLLLSSHLWCIECGQRLRPDYNYAKKSNAKLHITTVYCQDSTCPEYKRVIYLNFCWHCENVIDSRDCKHQEPLNADATGKRLLLCMYCGGGGKNTKWGTICPRCRNTNKDLLETRYQFIKCKKCGHDGETYQPLVFIDRNIKENMVQETYPIIEYDPTDSPLGSALFEDDDIPY